MSTGNETAKPKSPNENMSQADAAKPVEETESDETKPKSVSPTPQAKKSTPDSTKARAKKRRKAKEDREDGELDDDTNNNDHDPAYSNDYDTYEDYDEDDELSNQTEQPKSEMEKESSETVAVSSEPQQAPLLTTDPLSIAKLSVESKPAESVEANYADEYDYDDDDDDDYGLGNKRLKIDESGEVNNNNDEVKQQPVLAPLAPPAQPAQADEIKSKLNDGEENDNESSSSSDSALTAMSNISSGSLATSRSSSASLSNPNNKSSEPNKEAQDSNSNNSISVQVNEKSSASSSSESRLGLSESRDESATTGANKKVPPLKIVLPVNSGGSTNPYIKSENENKSPPDSSSSESNPAALSTPTAATRAKTANKTPRVASPVTTLNTAATKTTPTRRSTAAAAAAAAAVSTRSASPLLTSFTTAACSLAPDSGNQETETGNRRKLRSHTRQQQVGENGSSVGGGAKSPSPSPLTIQNENAINSNDLNGDQVSSGEPKLINNENRACELSNDSMMEADSNSVQAEPASTRKRRRNLALAEKESASNEATTLVQNIAESCAQISEAASGLVKNQAEPSAGVLVGAGLSENGGLSGETGLAQVANGEGQQNGGQNPVVVGLDAQVPVANCIRKFGEIRSEIAKRRDTQMQKRVDLKLPKNFGEFLLCRKTYLIRANRDARQTVPFYKPPNDLPEELKEFFIRQEKERYSLRLRHKVEQDKLVLLYEQEILRCYNRSVREDANQTIPFSFCTIIKDDEVYSPLKHEYIYTNTQPTTFGYPSDQQQQQQPNPGDQNSDFSIIKPNEAETSEAKFINSLNELRNKFQKLKDDLIKRQLNESDSLHAVQKMDFDLKLRELISKYKLASQQVGMSNLSATQAYTLYSLFQLNDFHVPIVHVNNKLELFDATLYINTNHSSSTLSSSNINNISIC